MTAPDDPLLELATTLDRLTSWIRRHSAPSPLSMTARTTLSRLDEQGPTPLGELATQEGISQPAMTGLVNRLEGLGLTAREPDPDDRRVSRILLTDAGRALIAERRSQRARTLAEHLQRLSPADQQALVAALPALHHLTQDVS